MKKVIVSIKDFFGGLRTEGLFYPLLAVLGFVAGALYSLIRGLKHTEVEMFEEEVEIVEEPTHDEE